MGWSGPPAGFVAVGLAILVLVPGTMMMMRRRDALGISLGLVGSGVVTSLAGIAAVIAGSNTTPWLIGSIPLIYAIGAVRIRRHGRQQKHFLWDPLDKFALVGSSLIAATAVTFLWRAPIKWDGRSIWYFNASWFAVPSAVYSELPVTWGGHTDYPPFGATFGAFAWLFGDLRNDWVPQTATGILTLAAIGTLSILLARGIEKRGERLFAAAVATAIALGVIQGNGLDGYMDGLAAALVATLVIMAYRTTDSGAVMVTALAASLVKNEALLFLLLIIVPLFYLRRQSLKPLIPALVVGPVWAIAIRTTGGAFGTWQPANVMPWSADFATRVSTIFATFVADDVLTFALLFWIGALLIAFGVNAPRHILNATFGMGAVAIVLVIVLAGIYLATAQDLEWHLATSADRLLIHPSMVLAASALSTTFGVWNHRQNKYSSLLPPVPFRTIGQSWK